MILADIEDGVDVHRFDTIVTGPPPPRIDRTAEAPPLGWQPDA